MNLGSRTTSPAVLAASLVIAFASTTAAAPQFGELQWTNTGELRPNIFTGHVLTQPSQIEGGITGAAPKILYAPSEADDAGYRAAIAAAAGGATVDYFDARNATPSVALMQGYDCVYTWANFAYANNVAFGDNLATFNDGGGDVVLGVFCTYTSGNFLSGLIMTSAYCPVRSPLGNNHFSADTYVGDGTSCLWSPIGAAPACNFRDFLVTQGTGIADGSFSDGEIAAAYRPGPVAGGDVVYNNGSGAFQLGCGGDWAGLCGNSCSCDVGGPQASCKKVDSPLHLNPGFFICNGAPVAGQTWNPLISQNAFAGGSPVQSFAVFGTAPEQGTVLFGQELLVSPVWTVYTCPGGACSFGPLPAALTGNPYYVQGLRADDAGAGVYPLLLNRLDIVIG